MLLYYIRHGEPTYCHDQLTPLGQFQAELVAKWLAHCNIDEIYASSSNRTVQTATPLSLLINKEITRLSWAHEDNAYRALCIGDRFVEGKSKWCYQDTDIIAQFNRSDVRALGRKWYTHPCFTEHSFGPGIERIQQNTDTFLKSFGYYHDLDNNCFRTKQDCDKTIAFFAHEGIGTIFLSWILDIPYPEFATRFKMSHTGITTIRFQKRGNIVIPEILSYSNDSHLYTEEVKRLSSHTTLP